MPKYGGTMCDQLKCHVSDQLRWTFFEFFDNLQSNTAVKLIWAAIGYLVLRIMDMDVYNENWFS